jgi:hypothetical protein
MVLRFGLPGAADVDSLVLRQSLQIWFAVNAAGNAFLMLFLLMRAGCCAAQEVGIVVTGGTVSYEGTIDIRATNTGGSSTLAGRVGWSIWFELRERVGKSRTEYVLAHPLPSYAHASMHTRANGAKRLQVRLGVFAHSTC